MVDERFVMHRFKATRLATLVGTVIMFGFFTYALVADRAIRWEYLIIMVAMAVTKLTAMFYYRKTN